jgi:glycosyltransferase involved in cell wall biosynthesis
MSDIKLSKNPFYKWRQKKIFKNADAFACRSYAIQKQFIQQFPAFKNKTFPALSGIPKTFINMEPNKRINPQRFKIITVVTRLVKRKNINKVLTALSSLSADNITNWQYTIIGRYHKETDLYGLLNKLNLNDKVNFLGHLDREAVIKELLDSDIFIMPSSPETFGLAYLESMACGCITIGSINEGIDGIIKDGENGLLCDPYNLNSIKEKLYTAMTLSEKDREKIINESLKTVENFSIEQKAQEYLDQLKKHIS